MTRPLERWTATLLLMLVTSPSSGPGQAGPSVAPKDWLDLASGAVILSVTSEYDRGRWSALGMIDGAPSTGWATKAGDVGPNTIVIELARKVRLRQFVVDVRAVDGKGRGVGALEVWGSTRSATDGFQKLLDVAIDSARRREVAINSASPVQWLRMVAKGNQGDAQYTEIMELEAYGDSVAPDAAGQQIVGVYETNYGLFRLQQSGPRIAGCYDHDGGILSGDTDGRVLRFEWRETAPLQVGTAVMVLTSTGDVMNGLWYEGGQLKGVWFGPRVTDGRQPRCTIATDGGLEKALGEGGRAILYGLHFDVDSDRLRPESEPVLREVLAALTANTEWNLVIEGHTDSEGTEEHNAQLSQRRAESVKKWLEDNGVRAGRLRSLGQGESRPVADNATPQGRALNRRVEIGRQ